MPPRVRWWEKSPGASPGPAAFLSHASTDKAVTAEVCAELEAAGLRCWVAPRDIVPGSEWAAAVIDGIRRCRVTVVLLSTCSIASEQVHREVDRAIAEHKTVLPVKIDSSPLEGSLAYYLASAQWIDLTRRPVRRHTAPLVARVQSVLSGTATPSAPPRPPARAVSELVEYRLDDLTSRPRRGFLSRRSHP